MNYSRSMKFVIAISLCSLIMASPVFAAVRQINSCVSITSPGSYILSKNINGSAAIGSCITIETSYVTLDLNGFTIAGAAVLPVGGIPFNDGIATLGLPTPRIKGIVIRNGTVAGFDVGISLGLADASTISDVKVIENVRSGIFLGDSCILTRNIARENGESGMAVGDGCVITENASHSNGTFGITSTSSTFIGNTARSNGDDGIHATQGSLLKSNTAAFNGDNGIEVACPGNIIGNSASFNTGTNLNIDTTLGTCNDIDNFAP